jgi:hypothetical protein
MFLSHAPQTRMPLSLPIWCGEVCPLVESSQFAIQNFFISVITIALNFNNSSQQAVESSCVDLAQSDSNLQFRTFYICILKANSLRHPSEHWDFTRIIQVFHRKQFNFTIKT